VDQYTKTVREYDTTTDRKPGEEEKAASASSIRTARKTTYNTTTKTGKKNA
jgi:hypothetical protein